MSAQTTERPAVADLAVPDVPLPPLPAAWSLPRAFLDTARANWSKVAMADSTGRLADLRLGPGPFAGPGSGPARARWGPSLMSDVMIPAERPGRPSLNIALADAGARIPINLNYSSSQAVIDAATDQAKHQDTSSPRARSIEKVHLTPKGTLVYLEDMPAKVTKRSTRPGPRPWPMRSSGQGLLGSFLPGLKDEDLEATATVMFTSGLDRRSPRGWSSRTAIS